MVNNCYIHIPFCNNICSYCDFCKLFYNENMTDKYLASLEQEILSTYNNEKLDTIYIGGGTPSSLNLEQLKKLFNILNIFKKSEKLEYTIECNFDSITLEKLKLFKENGINRISFGLETVNKNNLILLGRKENKKRVKYIIELCRSLGFDNINIDLMYAIPNETLDDLSNDIDFVLSLKPEHISTYSLIIEPHTKLAINKTDYIDEDLDYEMYKLIINKLKDYEHYEISNFSKKGYESKHNLCYWKNKNYYGFGLGTSSYIGNRRITNTRSIKKYMSGNYILEYDNLSKSDIMDYEMILGLRLLKGVNKKYFENKYEEKIENIYPIDSLVSNDLICNDENIYIPEDKIYVSNEILINFVRSKEV